MATGTLSVPFRAESYINFDGETSKHSKLLADFRRQAIIWSLATKKYLVCFIWKLN